MKTHYKFIHFHQVGATEWQCRNNKSTAALGEIKWYAPWRQYCYFPTAQAIYNNVCLVDIADFLGALNMTGDR